MKYISKVKPAVTTPITLSLILIISVGLLVRSCYLQLVFMYAANQQAVTTLIALANAADTILNQATHKAEMSYTLLIILWFSWLWAIPLILTRKRKAATLTLLAKDRKATTILIALTAAAIIVIYPYRYLHHLTPQGYDTPMYITVLNYMNQNPIGTLTAPDRCLWRPLFFAVIYPINKLIGYEELTLMTLPVILAILLAAATYTFTLKGTQNKFTASLAMLLTTTSYFTTRLSRDLFANFLATSIMLLALTMFLHTNEKSTRKNIAATITTLIILTLTHAWTATITLATLITYTAITLTKNRLTIEEQVKATMLTITPLTALLIILVVIKPNLIPSYMMIPLVDPFTSAPQWYWAAKYESPILLALAILGTYLAAKENTPFTRLLAAWVITISLLILVVGFDQFNYQRLYILYPVGILAAYALATVIQKATAKKPSKTRIAAVTTTATIALILIASITPATYYPIHVHRPDDKTMQQLYWIRNTYGYSNPNIIVPIYDPPAQPLEPTSTTHLQDINVWGWARAIIGDVIYQGHILNLLNQDPDDTGRVFNPQNKTIIIASQLYKITTLEKTITKKANNLGIFIVTMKNLTQINQFIKQHATWIDQTFNNTWRIVTNTLKGQASITENQLTITIPPTTNPGMLTIEYKPPQNTITTNGNIYIKAEWNLPSTTITVKTYTEVWLTQQKQIKQTTAQTWIIIPNKNTTTIKIQLTSSRITSNQENTIKITYVANL